MIYLLSDLDRNAEFAKMPRLSRKRQRQIQGTTPRGRNVRRLLAMGAGGFLGAKLAKVAGNKFKGIHPRSLAGLGLGLGGAIAGRKLVRQAVGPLEKKKKGGRK